MVTPLVRDLLYLIGMSKIYIFKNEGTIEKNPMSVMHISR